MLNKILNGLNEALHFYQLIHKINSNRIEFHREIILTNLCLIFSVLVFLLFAAVFIYANSYVIDVQALRPDCSVANETALLVKHPCKCSTYYVCLTDPPIPMQCPAGLQFNQTLQVCDYRFNVNCTDDVAPGC